MQLERTLPDNTLVTVSVGDHAQAFEGHIRIALVGVGNGGTVTVEGQSAVEELALLIQRGLQSPLRSSTYSASGQGAQKSSESAAQRRVLAVLERMAQAVRRDADDADAYAEALEELLGDLHSNDFFGTEGQSDPRGDFRNGTWSMARVEGIDG